MRYKRISFNLNVMRQSGCLVIKGDRNPNDKLIYKKGLYESWIMIPVSSKLFENWENCGCLNI